MSILRKRDEVGIDIDGDGDAEYFIDERRLWWEQNGYIIKWSLVGALVLFIIVYCVAGYVHARRRMRRNLPLLAYHRWLVPSRDRAHYAATHHPHAAYAPAPGQGGQQFAYNHQMAGFYASDGQHHQQDQSGNAYGMHHYPPPPPAYGHPANADAPPGYQPQTKVPAPQQEQGTQTAGGVAYPPQGSGEGAASQGGRQQQAQAVLDRLPVPGKVKGKLGGLLSRK